ncbi:MAG: App1 family protein [Leptospirales bacterium]|nr:App1 family protein [Leptospirales bacterium]
MKFYKKLILPILILLLSITAFTKEPAKSDTIIFPATYGWVDNDEINIHIHAWIFKVKEDSILRNSFIKILRRFFDVDTIENKKLFEDRIRYFLVDNKSKRDITVDIMGESYTLTKTASNGHSDTIIKLKDNSNPDLINKIINFSTVSSKSENPIFSGSLRIIGGKGYSIISDIDDTIKISNVLNRDELMNNTFTKKFEPVSGMSELYRIFEKKGCVFHYVSGSPWHLYPSINSFIIDEQFPFGSVNLKYFRVKDMSLMEFISADQLTYKLNIIKTIMDRFPERQFILIGDSGEKDPEVYSEIASQYKDKVKYIFIRDVGLIDEDSQRRKDVIAKSGDAKIVIFRDAKELEVYASDLK